MSSKEDRKVKVMGQSYSVNARYLIKDEEKALNSLKEYIASHTNVDWGIKEKGLSMDNYKDLLKVVFGYQDDSQWTDGYYDKEDNNPILKMTDEEGFIHFENDFTASYSWETVMDDVIHYIAKDLMNGSYFDIGTDYEYHEYEVKDGQIIHIRNNR